MQGPGPVPILRGQTRGGVRGLPEGRGGRRRRPCSVGLHRPEAPSPVLHASPRAAGPPLHRGMADRPRADGRGSRRGAGLATLHGRRSSRRSATSSTSTRNVHALVTRGGWTWPATACETPSASPALAPRLAALPRTALHLPRLPWFPFPPDPPDGPGPGAGASGSAQAAGQSHVSATTRRAVIRLMLLEKRPEIALGRSVSPRPRSIRNLGLLRAQIKLPIPYPLVRG
jgi:hypothetical protein